MKQTPAASQQSQGQAFSIGYWLPRIAELIRIINLYSASLVLMSNGNTFFFFLVWSYASWLKSMQWNWRTTKTYIKGFLCVCLQQITSARAKVCRAVYLLRVDRQWSVWDTLILVCLCVTHRVKWWFPCWYWLPLFPAPNTGVCFPVSEVNMTRRSIVMASFQNHAWRLNVLYVRVFLYRYLRAWVPPPVCRVCARLCLLLGQGPHSLSGPHCRSPWSPGLPGTTDEAPYPILSKKWDGTGNR